MDYLGDLPFYCLWKPSHCNAEAAMNKKRGFIAIKKTHLILCEQLHIYKISVFTEKSITWMCVCKGCSPAGGLFALLTLSALFLDAFIFAVTCLVCDWGTLESVASSWVWVWLALALALAPVSASGDCSSSSESDSADRLGSASHSWASVSSPLRSVLTTTLAAFSWGLLVLRCWIWFLEVLAARCPPRGDICCVNCSLSWISWIWYCGCRSWGGGGSGWGRWKGAMMPYRKAPFTLKYMNACRWVTSTWYIRQTVNCLSFSAHLIWVLTSIKSTRVGNTTICQVTGRSLKRARIKSLIPSPRCFSGSVMTVMMVTEMA